MPRIIKLESSKANPIRKPHFCMECGGDLDKYGNCYVCFRGYETLYDPIADSPSQWHNVYVCSCCNAVSFHSSGKSECCGAPIVYDSIHLHD
jgi:hypothetical protein